MLFGIPNQPAKHFHFVVSRVFVMDVNKGSLCRIGHRAVTRQPEKVEQWIPFRRACHGFELVNLEAVKQQEDSLYTRSATAFRRLKQLQKERTVPHHSDHLAHLASPVIESPAR